MLKDVIYTGLGVAKVLQDKVEKELQVDESKSISKVLEEKGKELDDEFKEKLKETIKDIVDELGLATKEDIEELKKELASSKK